MFGPLDREALVSLASKSLGAIPALSVTAGLGIQGRAESAVLASDELALQHVAPIATKATAPNGVRQRPVIAVS